MKKTFLTFALAVMLTASLAACTASPSGSGNRSGTGGSGGTTTQDSSANSRARSGGSGSTGGSGADATQGASGSTMHWAGRYYADESGDVFGGNDGIGNDIRRATDDMMDGMGNVVNDMTH